MGRFPRQDEIHPGALPEIDNALGKYNASPFSLIKPARLSRRAISTLRILSSHFLALVPALPKGISGHFERTLSPALSQGWLANS